MKSPCIIDTLAAGEQHRTVFVAFELGKAKWKLGIVVPGSGKLSQYTVDGGDVAFRGVSRPCEDERSGSPARCAW